jgi:VWFA-related protein
MDRRLYVIATVLLLSVSAWIALAQADTARLKFLRDVNVNEDRTEFRVVVAVTDADGHPLREFNKDHFTVSVDGKGVDLLSLERTTVDDQPLAVVLALDVSKSMKKDGAWKAARDAAIAFMNKLAPQDQVCLITFGDSVNLLSDFTKEKESVQQKLSEVEANDDSTLLYDALFKAASQAELATTGKVVVIAITDGKDQGSRVTLEDAARKAQSNGVLLYTLGFGPRIDRQTLQRVSTLTDGEYRYALKAEGLSALYDSIWERLKDGYGISVKTSPLRAGDHTLSIALNHRNEKIISDRQFKIPYPPLPGWAIITAASLGALLTLLAAFALVVNLIKRKRRPLSRPSRPTVWLDIVKGVQKGRRIRFQGRALLIGKAEDGSLQLLDDPSAGSVQAEILMDSGGTLILANHKIENGMLLNGNRLKAGLRVRLRSGDRITFGSTECVLIDQRGDSRAVEIEGTSKLIVRV